MHAWFAYYSHQLCQRTSFLCLVTSTCCPSFPYIALVSTLKEFAKKGPLASQHLARVAETKKVKDTKGNFGSIQTCVNRTRSRRRPQWDTKSLFLSDTRKLTQKQPGWHVFLECHLTISKKCHACAAAQNIVINIKPSKNFRYFGQDNKKTPLLRKGNFLAYKTHIKKDCMLFLLVKSSSSFPCFPIHAAAEL